MSLAAPFYTLFFILVFCLIFFFLWVHRRTTRDLSVFAQKDLQAKIVDFTGIKTREKQWILRIICLAFLILALCGPEWGYQWQETNRKGLEIVIALDTSNSMLATDIKPNRLERAKLAIKDLLSKLEGDRVGLVAFSGTSFLQCPLTFDYNAFGIALDALNTSSIPMGGTAIGEALVTAQNAFQAGANGSKIVIVMTDGENHEGDPVSIAREAAKKGVTLYTIGIGSPEGELIVITDSRGNSSYLKDQNGNVVKSTLNESILREMAAAGNGAYVRGSGITMGLQELYDKKLVKLDKTQSKSNWIKRYINRYQIPLFIALVFLLAELILGNRNIFELRKQSSFRNYLFTAGRRSIDRK